MPQPLRVLFGGLFLVYLGVMARLVLSPTSSLGDEATVRLISALDRFGVNLSASTAEFGLNVLLVVPLSLLSGLIFPRFRPSLWVASGFGISLAIEVIQFLGLSGRTGSSRDVVANTLGALVGAVLLMTVLTVIAELGHRRLPLDRSEPSSPGRRRPAVLTVLTGAYAVYLAAVVYLVWSPNPGAPGRSVLRVVDLAAGFGFSISSSAAERGLNVLMLVPLSLIGGLLIRRLTVADWLVVGFMLSIAVEVVQLLVLPTRSGSARDIVANTFGSLIGALILAAALAIWAQRPRQSPRGVQLMPAGGGSMER